MQIRVFLNDQKFSDRVPNEIYVVSTCEGPQKKFRFLSQYFQRMIHLIAMRKRSDLRVGALGGLGGGEGVRVKGREGKEGKEGKEGNENVNGFGLVIGLKVVNGGW